MGTSLRQPSEEEDPGRCSPSKQQSDTMCGVTVVSIWAWLSVASTRRLSTSAALERLRSFPDHPLRPCPLWSGVTFSFTLSSVPLTPPLTQHTGSLQAAPQISPIWCPEATVWTCSLSPPCPHTPCRKDICRPCLSTDKGRRWGEPSLPRSRYTLSTSPWCRVVRLVSRPED